MFIAFTQYPFASRFMDLPWFHHDLQNDWLKRTEVSSEVAWATVHFLKKYIMVAYEVYSTVAFKWLRRKTGSAITIVGKNSKKLHFLFL